MVQPKEKVSGAYRNLSPAYNTPCRMRCGQVRFPMEFTGKIIAILQPKGGVSKATGNEWKAQEFVIESHDQYPRKMCFEVFGADKIDQFNIQMGEELTVSFDIDSNQWQDRWFNRIRAWKVERVSVGAPMATGGSVPPAAPSAMPEFTPGDAKDDLPF